MSAHRRHTFDIAPRALLAHERREAVVAVAVALAAAFVFALLYGERSGTVATPVPQPQITTRSLPPAADTRRDELLARLSVWRAGYEAAVENGCKLQPLLNSPVARP
jgi:hypothetical protein